MDLSIDKSLKVGKSDLIDIDCIDQSVEIDDTLVLFIDLSRFYRFHRFISEDTAINPNFRLSATIFGSQLHLFLCSSKMKTDSMQTVNLLTIE